MNTKLKLSDIRIDGGTQARDRINQDCVAEYCERHQAGDEFPAPTVYFDGVDNWLADGFHRYHMLTRLKIETAEFEVRKGTQRDAILHAAAANGNHGLPRTPADKRKAVRMLLADPEWFARSNAWIAAASSVGDDLVAAVRATFVAEGSIPEPAKGEAKRVGRDGKARREPQCKPTMKVVANPKQQPEREPGDDSDLIAAQRAKSRENGREIDINSKRREARRAFGVIVQFFDVLKRHDEFRDCLQRLSVVIEGNTP